MDPSLVALAVFLLVVAAVKPADTSAAGESLDGFDTAIEPAMWQYAELLRAAGLRYDVSPWLLAGIMWRESNGGTALTPPGPAGTGDFTPRGPGNRYFQFADPNTGLPPDGKGWGRGLMQIDYGAHNDMMQVDQTDPATNINCGARILADAFTSFAAQGLFGDALTRAALAGYNASWSSVRSAIAAGADVDSVTTGRNYSSWVLEHVQQWKGNV